MEFLAAVSVDKLLSILYVALGLGLVIFIHELGHFMVAKWCGVKVERFSIGFGPILFRFKRGETEYALSAVPFGGYVKMLGQDDSDPSQMTDERIAQDPRSYPSKTVPQRMAIISAGVINNMVSAVVFFILAFSLGVHYSPSVVGSVVPGMPAWQAGLRQGDRIVRIGNRHGTQLGFSDIRQVVALSHEGEKIEIEIERRDKRLVTYVQPVKMQRFIVPSIFAEAESGLMFAESTDPNFEPVLKGLSSAKAEPPIRPGDLIRQIDGQPVASYADLHEMLAARRGKTIVLGVQRKGDAPGAPLTEIRVGPNYFRTLGLTMAIGKVKAIQKGSPAEGKLQVGDTITQVAVDGASLQIGAELDPLRLPDFFSDHAGKDVAISVKREVPNGNPVNLVVNLVPEPRPAWSERPSDEIDDCPLSLPAIGAAIHVLHHVVKVEGPALAAGIKETDNILRMWFVPATEEPAAESQGGRPAQQTGKPEMDPEKSAIHFAENKRNWPGAFWSLQFNPLKSVMLEVKTQGAEKPRVVRIDPVQDPEWYLPMRGFNLPTRVEIRRASNIGEAVSLGFAHTRNSLVEMWLTIRGLFSGRIDKKAVGGPIRIAETAYLFAKQGFADLLLFLAILSVSLAVLNFLPIPVLDGGHFAFLAWEGIRGKPPSEKVVVTATWFGLALVLGLMVWVIYMDISLKFAAN